MKVKKLCDVNRDGDNYVDNYTCEYYHTKEEVDWR